jgi:MFS family permease
MDSPTVKRFLPWVVAMALFMEQLDSTIVNTAVPAMAASLHVTPLSLKAVVASYILSLAVCIPVSGEFCHHPRADRAVAWSDGRRLVRPLVLVARNFFRECSGGRRRAGSPMVARLQESGASFL